MNKDILDAAILYVTNRPLFEEKFNDTLHKDYLDMLFLQATTRPDLAETVVVTICGFTPKDKKHGLDGLPSETRNEFAEVKASTTDTIRDPRGSFGNITINDPSQNIIDEYNETNPVFLFPIFVDGHLLVILSVKWENLRLIYEQGIRNIYEKNRTKKPGAAATRNFVLSLSKWLEYSSVEFIHSNSTMVLDLLKKIKVTKQYQKMIALEISKRDNNDIISYS